MVQANLLDAANNPAIQKTVFAPNNAAFNAVNDTVATLTPEQVCVANISQSIQKKSA